MLGFGPIAFFPVAMSGNEILYFPVSRITSGGVFALPGQVPTVSAGVNWDDGTIILWDDDTPILWG